MPRNSTKSEQMDAFWEDAHNNDKQYELTGSEAQGILKFLNLNRKDIKNAKTCLVIGVGFGHETRYLAEQGLKVSVLDISKKALNRVKNITHRQYLVSDISKLPPKSFDIIISHLVTQHMSDQGVKEQLKYCIKALKPSGVFAMQFSSLGKQSDNSMPVTLKNQQAGVVTRSVPYMNQIIQDAGGKVSWRSLPIHFPHVRYYWYGLHIQKQAAADKKTPLLQQPIWLAAFFSYSVKLYSKRLLHGK